MYVLQHSLVIESMLTGVRAELLASPFISWSDCGETCLASLKLSSISYKMDTITACTVWNYGD